MIFERQSELFYYLDPVNKTSIMFGPNPNMAGRFGGLSGDCTHVYGYFEKRLVGDLSGKVGDATGKIGRIYMCSPDFPDVPSLCGVWTTILGDISNLRGLVSGLSGEVSRLTFIDCTGWIGNCSKYFGHVLRILTDEEKRKGVSLEDYAKGLLGPK